MGVCGNVCCVAAVVEDSRFLSLGMLKYIVCLCKGCDGCCVSVCMVELYVLSLLTSASLSNDCKRFLVSFTMSDE